MLKKKSKIYLMTVIYHKQLESSKKRGHKPPTYTRLELREWLINQPIFHTLYDAWVESGHDVSIKPSVDRIDDYKSYSFDNIQVMTWGENDAKGHSDRKNGINNKASKAVLQYDLDFNFIREHHSIAEAQRNTDIYHTTISNCCKGKHKRAGKFRWRFKDD